jgi:Fe2+ or Zn2+ uptake regulation protein
VTDLLRAALPSNQYSNKRISYAQLYTLHMPDLRKLNAISPAATNILLVLIEIMNRRNAIVISVEGIERISGYSKSTVIRALSLLEGSNFIQRIRADSATVIVINNAVAWKDKPAYRARMAEFDARVIAFDFEQFGEIESKKKLKKIGKLRD